jgi:SAM-dependent methyltransferase
MITGGWDTPEVTAAQLALVKRELLAPEKCAPFVHFREAMDALGVKEGSLLDVGCGVGHYGALCARYYPVIEYYGSDASDSMIDVAQKLFPSGVYFPVPFEMNEFYDFDIVLISQVMEMTDSPWTSLAKVLRTFKKHLILHRLRLTDGPSHAFDEPTYCGHIGHEYLWNLDVLTNYILYHESVSIRGGRWADDPTQATLCVTR